MKRNLIATLVFSQGVPMLLGGDEMGRTQRGNNNAYCQDNEISWVELGHRRPRPRLLAFTRECLQISATTPCCAAAASSPAGR